MTKEVLVTVRGIQKSPQDGGAAQETVSKAEGVFYEKNGKKYVLYEETGGETAHTTKTTLKLDRGCVDLIRSGALRTHMFFEIGVNYAAEYQTPFGSMILNIMTKDLKILACEDRIEANIAYELRSNDELLSDCKTCITVSPL